IGRHFAPENAAGVDAGLSPNKPDHRYLRLLRARRERPRGRTAEQSDELAPFHASAPAKAEADRMSAAIAAAQRAPRNEVSSGSHQQACWRSDWHCECSIVLLRGAPTG